jgi:hypothetical protein
VAAFDPRHADFQCDDIDIKLMRSFVNFSECTKLRLFLDNFRGRTRRNFIPLSALASSFGKSSLLVSASSPLMNSSEPNGQLLFSFFNDVFEMLKLKKNDIVYQFEIVFLHYLI